MKCIGKLALGVAALCGLLGLITPPPAAAQDKKPNILVIMGDDVGWFNIGAYHRGMMSGKTPNLDKLASQGMMFTDYYAEASCTAGRANFITGEIPLRTGLTKVPATKRNQLHGGRLAGAALMSSSTAWLSRSWSADRPTTSTVVGC